MRLAGGLVDRIGDDAEAVLEVRGEHTVVSGEMGAGAWHEGSEAGDEFDGVEHDMRGAVVEGVLESIHDLPAVIDREAFVGDGRAGDVATEPFEGIPVTGSAARAGMEGESQELSDAGGDGGAAFEEDSEPGDEMGGPFGEVGQRAFAHLAGVAIGLAKQDGGRGVAVGDGLDVHGY